MNTSFWGPHAWIFLHSVAQNYPENNPTLEIKKKYKLFFETLGTVLPCCLCQDSYKKFILQLPIDNFLDRKDRLQYWLYLIHELVNNKLRLQGHELPPTPTFKEVWLKYSLKESQNKIVDQNNFGKFIYDYFISRINDNKSSCPHCKFEPLTNTGFSKNNQTPLSFNELHLYYNYQQKQQNN